MRMHVLYSYLIISASPFSLIPYKYNLELSVRQLNSSYCVKIYKSTNICMCNKKCAGSVWPARGVYIKK
jgi:hypothetical protein